MAIEIVDFPINSMVIFHCKLLVHQRVVQGICIFLSVNMISKKSGCWSNKVAESIKWLYILYSYIMLYSIAIVCYSIRNDILIYDGFYMLPQFKPLKGGSPKRCYTMCFQVSKLVAPCFGCYTININ